MHEPEVPEPARHPRPEVQRRGRVLRHHGIRRRPEPGERPGQAPARPAAGRGPRLAQGDRRGGRVPARPRDRPPRPQARQHLHGRGDRQDRRLRPGQAHHPRPGHRALREHRHVPLHGPRGRLGQVRQADRHLLAGHHPVRDDHRARAVRGGDGRRGPHEAPDVPGRRLGAARPLPVHRGPALAKDPKARPAHVYHLLPPEDAPQAPSVRFIGEGKVTPPLPPDPKPQARPPREEVFRIGAEEPVFYIGPETRPPQSRRTLPQRVRQTLAAARPRRAGAARMPTPMPTPASRRAGRAAPPARRPGPGRRAGHVDAPGHRPGRALLGAGQRPARRRLRTPAAAGLPLRPDAAGDLGHAPRLQAPGRAIVR